MKKKIITALLVAGLMVMNAVPSFAVANQVIDLGTVQAWKKVSTPVYYPGGYSYVQARCQTVYPTSGTDNLTQIHARIFDVDDQDITRESYVTLTEGTGYHNVYIKDGCIFAQNIYFKFRATSNVSTKAVVDFQALT